MSGLQTVRQIWPLLFGVSALFLSGGLLHTLVAVRADAEGFSTQSVGLIQSSYQIGWLLAALFAPIVIRNVGHVRVFAAVASLGSAMILTHIMLIDEWAWAAGRLIMGICTGGLMIVSESWLNDMSTNKTRGRMMALYTMCSWGAPVLGIWLLRFGDTNESLFFLLTSVLISIGAIPILLSASKSPGFVEAEHFSIRKLYKISPVGAIGVLFSGMLHGVFFGSVAIYATTLDMSVAEISNVAAFSLAAGILMQWPIALLSDRMDRRLVLCLSAILVAIPAIFFATYSQMSTAAIYLATALIGAFSLSLYSQCIAHANDYLSPSQVIAATGSLVLLYGIGYAITPLLTSILIAISPSYFYWINGVLASLLALFVIYRIRQRKPVEDQGEMTPIATASPYYPVISAAEQAEADEEINTTTADKKDQ